MKPFRLLFVALALALGLSACGGSVTAPTTAPEKPATVAQPSAETSATAAAQEDNTSASQPAATSELTSATENPPTPEPTATTEPTATPVQAEPGTSRANPLPLGSEFKGETWSIIITDVIRGKEAAGAVAKANQFNDPPRQGYEYIIANVALANISTKQEAQSASFAVDLRVTGDRNITYSRVSVTPAKPFEGELLPEGAVEGQIVFEVPEGEKNLMFIVGEMMSFDTEAMRFVAIDENASITPQPALAQIKPTELGLKRDNPAKIGDTLVAGPWEFSIVEAMRGDEAAKRIKEANSFNDPAPTDQEYVLVRLKARYLGVKNPDRGENINGAYLKIAGEKNVVYDSPSVVAPEPQLDATLFAGGETEGWEVLSVSKDEKGLIVIFEPLFSFSSDDTRYIGIE